MTHQPEITLYLRPGWSSLFPHILLHEAAVQFNTIGITDRTVASDAAFAAQNPKKQIPVLVVNGMVVTENPAIAHAISALKSEPRLMGADAEGFIRVCEWLNWISASLHAQAWSPYLRPWRFTTEPGGEAAVRAKAFEKICERFEMIEARLPEGGEWAVGAAFTAVDAYLLPYFQWAGADLDFDLEVQCPKYCALMEKVIARPSVQRALRSEASIKEGMGGDPAFEGNR